MYIKTQDRGRLLTADACLSFAVVRHFKDSWSLAARLERGEVTDSSVEHMRMKEISFAIYVTFFFILLSLLLSFSVPSF